VGVCLGTLLARAKSSACPAAGFNRRDLDYRTQAIASAVAQGQAAYYALLAGQGLVRPIRTRWDLDRHWSAWSAARETEPVGLILAMEGADPIVEPADAQQWWDRGLRCVGLAHYGPSAYAVGTGAEGPLSDKGRALLLEFDRLGMIVDLTHCSVPGFFEVLDRFTGPVLASHNMCRALVPADRQFSDEQIRALVERGAVIGMALDAWMLHPGWVIGRTPPDVVSIDAVANHVDHICQIAGSARHVGIGSDLDGGFGTEQTPGDLDSIVDLHTLEPILAARGYADADIDAIFFGNWLRFFSEALPND
jgi:membrane dipeptidase